jgi:hypothetical protein
MVSVAIEFEFVDPQLAQRTARPSTQVPVPAPAAGSAAGEGTGSDHMTLLMIPSTEITYLLQAPRRPRRPPVQIDDED